MSPSELKLTTLEAMIKGKISGLQKGIETIKSIRDGKINDTTVTVAQFTIRELEELLEEIRK